MKKIKEILKDLKLLRQKDDEIQEALGFFVSQICGNSYTPIIDFTFCEAYLKSFENEEVADWLGYYLYEAPAITGDAEVTTEGGGKYNFKNKKEVIKFFQKEYGM